MSCNKPFKAYKSREGGLTLNPADSSDGMLYDYKCNQCHGCKKSNTGAWTSRLVHENAEHETAIFLTLTYDEEQLPLDGSLVKEHPQLFVKRLRDQISPIKIRTYTAGEYGKNNPAEFIKFGRPHYHLIILGWEPDDKELLSNANGQFLYTSEIIERVWGKGHCPFGDVTPQSCQYVAQYTQKKVYGKNQAPEHYTITNPYTGELVKMEPEFSTMSRRPGIGFQYFNRWLSDFFPSDFCIRKGQKVAVPKYYLNLLETINPEMHEEIIHRRKLARKLHRKDNTPERLATKEKILDINIKRKLREAII